MHAPRSQVFIDPDSDNWFYYEIEINGLGTSWDLLLGRPYRCARRAFVCSLQAERGLHRIAQRCGKLITLQLWQQRRILFRGPRAAQLNAATADQPLCHGRPCDLRYQRRQTDQQVCTRRRRRLTASQGWLIVMRTKRHHLVSLLAASTLQVGLPCATRSPWTVASTQKGARDRGRLVSGPTCAVGRPLNFMSTAG